LLAETTRPNQNVRAAHLVIDQLLAPEAVDRALAADA
jgi:hypothetical protein